jgi:hypothetical protein
MNDLVNVVKCYLLCIQTMKFFLRTGFGTATQSYGGTSQNLYMGLAQGSGASPAAWTAISTVMLAAYKHRGYGTFFTSAWSGIVLGIASLLYVDDTDLQHMCRDSEITEAFVPYVQIGTYNCVKLLQATEGNFKPT